MKGVGGGGGGGGGALFNDGAEFNSFAIDKHHVAYGLRMPDRIGIYSQLWAPGI